MFFKHKLLFKQTFLWLFLSCSILAVSCSDKKNGVIDEIVKTPEPTYHQIFTYEGKQYKPGDTVYGYKNYIKLVVGDNDAPLFFGVPHDGIATGNPEIPETGTTGRDVNTLPLATKIAERFKAVTQKR